MSSLHDIVTDVVGKMVGIPAIYTKTGTYISNDSNISMIYKITIKNTNDCVAKTKFFGITKRRFVKNWYINLKMWQEEKLLCNYMIKIDNIKRTNLNKGLLCFGVDKRPGSLNYWVGTEDEKFLCYGYNPTDTDRTYLDRANYVNNLVQQINNDYINLLMELI